MYSDLAAGPVAQRSPAHPSDALQFPHCSARAPAQVASGQRSAPESALRQPTQAVVAHAARVERSDCCSRNPGAPVGSSCRWNGTRLAGFLEVFRNALIRVPNGYCWTYVPSCIWRSSVAKSCAAGSRSGWATAHLHVLPSAERCPTEPRTLRAPPVERPASQAADTSRCFAGAVSGWPGSSGGAGLERAEIVHGCTRLAQGLPCGSRACHVCLLRRFRGMVFLCGRRPPACDSLLRSGTPVSMRGPALGPPPPRPPVPAASSWSAAYLR